MSFSVDIFLHGGLIRAGILYCTVGSARPEGLQQAYEL